MPPRSRPSPARDDADQRGPRPASQLARQLRGMDGSSYGRYKSLTGTWEFDDFDMTIERVQSDPYAPPSRLVVEVPEEVAGFPVDLYQAPVRARALGDYLARQAAAALAGSHFKVDAGGQEVLDRSACRVRSGTVTLRLGFELPGRGRRIDGGTAERGLCQQLPRAVADALCWDALDPDRMRHFVDTVEDTDALRRMLPGLGLVAFVADGSVLPRRSGVDDRPLSGDTSNVVPFTSPSSLRVEVDLPHRGRVAGMGVPEGVTLVVGGGFHGKSTLLRSLERGVYDHVPGDGRELVAARPDTVKIRAEDGRRVQRVDVSAFVGNLPNGADTSDFSTDNGSGSTSQAASMAEALEAGASVLLLDEDTAATNLMIRDARMQSLVASGKEPLTPFVDLIGPLHREHGVSTVLVMGGSGDYMDVADRVVMMEAYEPSDVTEHARALAAEATGRQPEATTFPAVRHRRPDPDSVNPLARGKRRLKGRSIEGLVFGESDVDLRAVEQLVDPSQVIGIGLALMRLARGGHLDGKHTLAEALDRLDAELDADGAAALGEHYPGDFAAPRRFEVAAALNRLRSLRIAGFR